MATSRFSAVAALLALAALVAGCATSIGPSQVGRDALGPFPNDWERVVRFWVENEFPNYSRVDRLQMRRPEPGVANPPRLSLQSARHGWYALVTFHAATRVNAPTGPLHYAVLIRDGAVVAHQKQLFSAP